MNARGWVALWARCADNHRRACASKLVLADVVDGIEGGVQEPWAGHPLTGHYGERTEARDLRRAAIRHAHIAERAHERELQARDRDEDARLVRLGQALMRDLGFPDPKGRW